MYTGDIEIIVAALKFRSGCVFLRDIHTYGTRIKKVCAYVPGGTCQGMGQLLLRCCGGATFESELRFCGTARQHEFGARNVFRGTREKKKLGHFFTFAVGEKTCSCGRLNALSRKKFGRIYISTPIQKACICSRAKRLPAPVARRVADSAPEPQVIALVCLWPCCPSLIDS